MYRKKTLIRVLLILNISGWALRSRFWRRSSCSSRWLLSRCAFQRVFRLICATPLRVSKCLLRYFSNAMCDGVPGTLFSSSKAPYGSWFAQQSREDPCRALDSVATILKDIQFWLTAVELLFGRLIVQCTSIPGGFGWFRLLGVAQRLGILQMNGNLQISMDLLKLLAKIDSTLKFMWNSVWFNSHLQFSDAEDCWWHEWCSLMPFREGEAPRKTIFYCRTSYFITKWSEVRAATKLFQKISRESLRKLICRNFTAKSSILVANLMSKILKSPARIFCKRKSIESGV